MNPAAGHPPPCQPALEDLPGNDRILVAFSGGPDSVCLAALLARAGLDRPVECLHVDHGLDPNSAERAGQATAISRNLNLPCHIEVVEISTDDGIEAGARKARYDAMARHLGASEVLVTAHHADDQAETVLMRLVRGAGPAGLAGIPRLRRFAAGWLARPLLDWSRDDIRSWLEQQGLQWIEDPANRDQAMDRNYITSEVMPALVRRWPGALDGIRRSARLSAGATGVLADVALADMMRFCGSDQRLERIAADWLGEFRFIEMLRYWCHHLGHPSPPAARLEEFMGQLQTADSDRQPELRWADSVLRAHGQWLWLEPIDRLPDNWSQDWSGQSRLVLPGRLGTLEIKGQAATSDFALKVCPGQPGERIRICDPARSVSVRKLLYEAGIPPWQRNLWPRVWLNERLVAVGDRWLDADFFARLDNLDSKLEWKTRLYRPEVESTP